MGAERLWRKGLGVVGIVVLFGIWLPLGIFSERWGGQQPFRAEQGVIDLAGWDGSGRIALDGEWEFYWNELLQPGETPRGERSWMEVPGVWSGSRAAGAERPVYGAATYRLRLTHLSEPGVYRIKKMNIRFASAIYVDGRLVLEDGKPALSAEAYVPGNSPGLAVVEIKGSEAEIIVHAANYDYIDAGVPMSLYFGKEEAINAAHERSLIRESAMAVVLAVIGLIHLVLFAAVWLYGQRDEPLLLFGLTCVTMAVFNGLLGERPLALLLDGLSFQTLYTIKDMSALAGFLVSLYLMMLLQGKGADRRLTKLFALLLLGSLVLFPFLSIREYLPLYRVTILLEHVLMARVLWSAAARHLAAPRGQRYESLLLLLAVLLLNLYSYGCLLFGMSMLGSLLISQIYLILFSLVVFLVIVYRFYGAFRDMERMHRKLLRLDRQKDEFLSSTTYQLKAPLQDIVHLADSLAHAGGPAPGSARSLALIAGTGRRLGYLVQDLHDFSRLKHEDIVPEPRNLDLRSAVGSVLELHRFLLSGRLIELANGVPETLAAVYADEDRLEQILHRLVERAALRAEEGRIEVTAEEELGFAVVTVDFDGRPRPAPDPDVAPCLAAADGEAADLALSITRRLIELQGGLALQPLPGKEGRSFRFSLLLEKNPAASRKAAWPAAGEAAAASETPVALAGGSKGQTVVLVAEPDAASRHAVCQLLAQEGLRAVSVRSAEQARAALALEGELSLVLLGVSLADGSGFDALEQLRGRFSPSELPVLMLTGRRREEERRLALDLGANDYISKPFEAEELLARVRSLVKLRQSVREAREREIAFLRSQINPHFLYNALGAIAELCVEEPEKAERLTLHLSGYLRGSFDFGQRDGMSTLGAELRLIEAYTEIEKARFGSRLQVTLRCEADPALRFPPLLLQPLVENAIRHGLLSRPQGGEVKVTVVEREGYVHAAVEDDGAGFDAQAMLFRLEQPERIGGVGLWNVSERLRLLYGERLGMDSRTGFGSRLTFRIPASSRTSEPKEGG